MATTTKSQPVPKTGSGSAEGPCEGDGQFLRASIIGVAVGTPLIYLATAAVFLLAAPGLGGAAFLIALWPALFGGLYLGGLGGVIGCGALAERGHPACSAGSQSDCASSRLAPRR